MRTQRAQLTPADTNTATLYQVGTKASGAHAQGPTGEGIVRVMNTDTSDRTCRLFHDFDGVTYDDTTALCDDLTVLANNYRLLPIAALRREGESIGVRSSNASSLTFTYEADS